MAGILRFGRAGRGRADGVTVIGVAIYIAGGIGLPRPDLHGWLQGGTTAVQSRPLGAALRR